MTDTKTVLDTLRRIAKLAEEGVEVEVDVDGILACIERLISNLAECYRLSGADPDGNEDWRLAIRAVEEVRRMRQEYDSLAGQYHESLHLRAEMEEERDAARLQLDEAQAEYRYAMKTLGAEAARSLALREALVKIQALNDPDAHAIASDALATPLSVYEKQVEAKDTYIAASDTYIAATPCDPDCTDRQFEAYKKWKDAKAALDAAKVNE